MTALTPLPTSSQPTEDGGNVASRDADTLRAAGLDRSEAEVILSFLRDSRLSSTHSIAISEAERQLIAAGDIAELRLTPSRRPMMYGAQSLESFDGGAHGAAQLLHAYDTHVFQSHATSIAMNVSFFLAGVVLSAGGLLAWLSLSLNKFSLGSPVIDALFGSSGGTVMTAQTAWNASLAGVAVLLSAWAISALSFRALDGRLALWRKTALFAAAFLLCAELLIALRHLAQA
jgi:hypothetical protein